MGYKTFTVTKSVSEGPWPRCHRLSGPALAAGTSKIDRSAVPLVGPLMSPLTGPLTGFLTGPLKQTSLIPVDARIMSAGDFLKVPLTGPLSVFNTDLLSGSLMCPLFTASTLSKPLHDD
jgi:hypothetical protein